MHNKVYLIWKRSGITPLQQLREFKYAYEKPLPEKLTYAGRLDPLAEGLLPIVAGEDGELKRKISYLSKTYEAKVLFGVKTDSGDILGKICGNKGGEFDEQGVREIVRKNVGYLNLVLPRYSSKLIDKYGFEEMVKVEDEFKKSEVLESEYLSSGKLRTEEVLNLLKKVERTLEGDFRHEKIQTSWKEFSINKVELDFFTVKFRVSGGTYIRSLVDKLSRDIGVDMCLFSLTRISVGNWDSPGEYTEV